MGCFQSKQKIAVKTMYNKAWDLLDTDGDFKVSSEELQAVSKNIHEFQIKCCEEDLTLLKNKDPTDYVLSIIGKKQTDLLTRSDFNKFASMLPHTKWHSEIIPILRRKEVERLRSEV